MRRDDRDDPFDEFFEEIERMMNEMMGSNAEFHLEHNNGGGNAGHQTGDVHFDSHETDDTVRVVADLPGVTKEDINLKCDGTTLHVNAEGPERTYQERIDLPSRVDERSASATYNNGILEVTFDRVDDSTSIDL
jgi:HSP20 family protein